MDLVLDLGLDSDLSLAPDLDPTDMERGRERERG